MEFRPCIDIHNGKVKQIVGSSLRDAGDQASENFVSGQDAPFYARMYQSRGIRGGHILDLSCRYRADAEEPGYYIVTDRWQKFTTERVTNELLEKLSSRCSEFLVHAVDVEGKSGGIEKPLAQFLGDWGKIPITYAGGVHSFEDLEEISQLGRNRLNVTIGSALDLFGGPMSYEQVLTYISKCNAEKEKSI